MTYAVRFEKHSNAGTESHQTGATKVAEILKRSGNKACLVLAVLQFMTACDPRAPGVSAKSSQAEALFRQHCSTAGETIKRTVKDVGGVFLLKGRPEEMNFSDQFAMDDPYGNDLGGEAYISSFLKAKHELRRRYASRLKEPPLPDPNELIGYDYVDMADPQSGARLRFTTYVEQPGKTDSKFSLDFLRVVLQKSPAPLAKLRYGVTYDDISTPEDRNFWIAGSSLKVIDLETNEVIAERIGYMIDRGQGATAGGRSPWLLAAGTACPSFPGKHSNQANQTARFVEKVLLPIRRVESNS